MAGEMHAGLPRWDTYPDQRVESPWKDDLETRPGEGGSA